MDQKKTVYASAKATIIAIVFVVAATILAEESLAFKDWLKSITGHHWVTKSVFMALLYVVSLAAIGQMKKRVRTNEVEKALMWLLASSLIGTAAIFGYYTWHFFG